MTPASARRIKLGTVAFCAATAIPMSFFYYVLPAVLRQAGHSAEMIGIVALVYLPYALRVLWAPPIDRLAAGKANRYRAIAFAMVIATIVCILGFMGVDPEKDLATTLGIATLAFALLATGLTALDGYVLATLRIEDRERIPVYQAAGFTLGGIVLGICALAADGLAWTTMVLLLAAATAALTVPMLILPTAPAALAAAGQNHLPQRIWQFLKRPPVRRRIAFSVLAQGGLGLPAGYLPVLQVDAGLSPGQIGLFGVIGANICGLIAAVAAGVLLARLGGWRTLLAVLLATGGAFVAVALAHVELNGPAFAVSIAVTVMMLGYGYIVPYRALILTICDAENGATQAALLSCLDVVASLLAASLAGVVVSAIGVTGLFAVSAAACTAGALVAFQTVGRDEGSSLAKSAKVSA